MVADLETSSAADALAANRRSARQTVMIAVPIALAVIDAGLILYKVHEAFFISVALWQYVTIIWSAITAVIAVASGLGPAIRIARTVITGREGAQPTSLDRIVLRSAKAVARYLRRPVRARIAAVAGVAIAVAVILIPILPELTPTSSGVLAVTLGNLTRGTDTSGLDKYIYVADRDNGQLLVFRSSSLSQIATAIPIGTQGNVAGKGKPESLIELRRKDLHLVFVTDTASSKVHIIDVGSNAEIQPGLSVGSVPRAMAITQDGRKLFVSNEQTIPNAGIMVFDVSSIHAADFHLVTNITDVNCPEGMALSPYGDRLYVATQCGGGKDPVFIIDTATNKKIGSIPNLAVGSSVAVNRDGSRLYVGRGNYPCQQPKTGEAGSPLSVVDLRTLMIINTLCLRTSVGALTASRDPEARYLIVANGTRLSVFDTKALDTAKEPLNDVPLEAPVESFGVADDNSVYAFMPQSRRLFIYSPAGLTRD
jgi:DNA-binding beta-propeller fold protein YncE